LNKGDLTACPESPVATYASGVKLPLKGLSNTSILQLANEVKAAEVAAGTCELVSGTE